MYHISSYHIIYQINLIQFLNQRLSHIMNQISNKIPYMIYVSIVYTIYLYSIHMNDIKYVHVHVLCFKSFKSTIMRSS